MSNKNTAKNVIAFVSFVIVVISFFFLIKSGDYKNFIIFLLVAFSFSLGYFMRRGNNILKDSYEPPKEQKEITEVLSDKKMPQEFIDEQERYKKLSLQNKPEEVKQ